MFSESSEKNRAKPQTHNTDVVEKKIPKTHWKETIKNKLQLTTVTNSEAFWKGSNVLFSAPTIYIYKVSWWITNSKTEGVSFRPNVCKNKQHCYSSLAHLDFNLEYMAITCYLEVFLSFVMNLQPTSWRVPLEVSRLFSKHTGVHEWGCTTRARVVPPRSHPCRHSLNLRQHHINLQIQWREIKKHPVHSRQTHNQD